MTRPPVRLPNLTLRAYRGSTLRPRRKKVHHRSRNALKYLNRWESLDFFNPELIEFERSGAGALALKRP
jgi:hypothetical protein